MHPRSKTHQWVCGQTQRKRMRLVPVAAAEMALPLRRSVESRAPVCMTTLVGVLGAEHLKLAGHVNHQDAPKGIQFKGAQHNGASSSSASGVSAALSPTGPQSKTTCCVCPGRSQEVTARLNAYKAQMASWEHRGAGYSLAGTL